jgi:uncharacterized glyoxalase superfamily protein PhnB
MTTNSPVPDAAKESGAGAFQARGLTISLTVKDLTKSVAWYSEVVGFVIDRKLERDGKLRGCVLKAGDVQISINQDDGAKGWTRIKGEGFSIRISTDQNIDTIAKRIKENGGTLDSEPADMPWGARMFRLRDLDGYKIAISSVPKI